MTNTILTHVWISVSLNSSGTEIDIPTTVHLKKNRVYIDTRCPRIEFFFKKMARISDHSKEFSYTYLTPLNNNSKHTKEIIILCIFNFSQESHTKRIPFCTSLNNERQGVVTVQVVEYYLLMTEILCYALDGQEFIGVIHQSQESRKYEVNENICPFYQFCPCQLCLRLGFCNTKFQNHHRGLENWLSS